MVRHLNNVDGPKKQGAGGPPLLLPHWPVDWLDALRGAPHYAPPVQRPGGFLLLLAFLRWRQPEARMLGRRQPCCGIEADRDPEPGRRR